MWHLSAVAFVKIKRYIENNKLIEGFSYSFEES